MGKVAILTDSNSGITSSQAEAFGVHVLPTPFYIDNQMYYEGVDLSEDEFFRLQEEDREIHTSTPLMGDVLDKWDELLADYDEIVYIPLSSGLSSSCMSATAEAEEDEYDGKVFVVNNQRISVTMKLSVIEAKKMADEGRSGSEIKAYLEEHRLESTIYITVATLKYLKKGGRITPAVAAIGSMLKIKPVLQIRGEKLDSFSKARTMKHAKQIMIDAIKDDLKGFLDDPEGKDCVISVAHTNNREGAEVFREELLKIFPDRQIIIDPLSTVVACHIGSGALAVTATKSFVKELA